jgi:hypothetical protein
VSKPLKGGAVRLLDRHDGAAGRAFRAAYDALVVDLGPFRSRLARMEASRTAAAWVNLQVATSALTALRRQREQGRGRRPSAQAVERAARRQGLADQTYSQALDRLRELAAQRSGISRPSTPAEMLAAITDERGRAGEPHQRPTP